jgi:hypothetical protein
METRFLSGDNFVIYNSDHETWTWAYEFLTSEVCDEVLDLEVDKSIFFLANVIGSAAQVLDENSVSIDIEPIFQEQAQAQEQAQEQHRKRIWCSLIAAKMAVCILSYASKYNQIKAYLSVKFVLDKVKTFVSGRLYKMICDIESKCDVFDPIQASKGWKCPICMSSSHSHLAARTSCGHEFHYGCYQKFSSPICPMCRTRITGLLT